MHTQTEAAFLSGTSTLNSLIDNSRDVFSERPAAGFAFEKPLTYQEFWRRVMHAAAFLKGLGLKKGDRAALLGENSPAWGVAYFAVVRLGAIAVPILPDFPQADVSHILDDTKAKIVFVTQRQLSKIYDSVGKNTKAVITLDDAGDDNKLIATKKFSDCLAEAAALPEAKLKLPEDLAKPDDIASIIYTSGTSGHSKGVMLTHGNFLSNIRSTTAVVQVEEDWTFLSILPMSHAYEFTISFLLPLANGARIVYAGQPPTPTILEKICKIEQPTVICLVPMVMEKIYKKRIMPALSGNPFLKLAIKVPFVRAQLLRQIGRRLLNYFGGSLKLAAIGGAAFNLEVEKFLAEAGFPYIFGYGLTEASPLISGGPFLDPTIAVGSTGKPVPGVEVKIVNPLPETGVGEIYARGGNIMKGYYNNPRATTEAIDADGWLATGDLGYLDQDNNLFVKGRLKSVIVLSHGENIFPEAIEDTINSSIYVLESLVTEDNDRLEAWVYLDYELIDRETSGKSQPQKKEHITRLLDNLKSTVNLKLPAYSRLSRVVERTEPFTKTATQKIKRYLYTAPK